MKYPQWSHAIPRIKVIWTTLGMFYLVQLIRLSVLQVFLGVFTLNRWSKLHYRVFFFFLTEFNWFETFCRRILYVYIFLCLHCVSVTVLPIDILFFYLYEDEVLDKIIAPLGTIFKIYYANNLALMRLQVGGHKGGCIKEFGNWKYVRCPYQQASSRGSVCLHWN